MGRVFLCQPQKPHTAAIGLLLDSRGGKDRIDDLARIASDAFSPFAETVAVPFKIFLMVLRHMFRDGAVLPLASVSAAMRGDSVMVKERKEQSIAFRRQICDN